MTPTTTTTNPIWTVAHTELFSACKDMFTINPSTGEVEQKNDKAAMENLMRTIARITMCGKKEEQHQCAYNSSNAASGLKQIVIWPGGKKNELKNILANVPSYDRFFEPFVGGGSVFMGINAREHYINDFSTNLISLYKNIATSHEQFLHYLYEIDMSIERAGKFAHKHQEVLANIYEKYRTNVTSKEEMKKAVSDWCSANQAEILDIVGEFKSLSCKLVKEINNYLCGSKGKFISLKRKDKRDINEINNHIEHAVKGSIYKVFRSLFNDRAIEEGNIPLHSALMVYIHQFCYRGNFKYDRAGNFNTAFNQIGNLKRRLQQNLKFYKSNGLAEHFKNAHLYNYDFEEFLNKTTPQENDFILLDPPYDEMFSAYDGNEFNRGDHKRLANYLLTRCKSKWMMIINKTDFILDLYNQPGIHIQEYDKIYTCQRKEVVHLMITNYDTNEAGSSILDNIVVEHKLAA